jgi:hypothetical protein
MTDFAKMIIEERERLASRRATVLAQRDSIDTELAAIDREMKAIEAYEKAKNVGPATAPKTGSRAPRGSRQQEIIATIAKYPDGITRGDLIEAMGVKDDKAGEQSVSNVLNTLKKSDKVTSRDGRYFSV